MESLKVINLQELNASTTSAYYFESNSKEVYIKAFTKGTGENYFSITSNLVAITSIDVSEGQQAVNVYPNPGKDDITISFTLNSLEHVSLRIIDAAGREVKNVVNEMLAARSHNIQLDARPFPG